ncbi:hypothetical protein BMS3Abin10_02466 [bacterium BMS3Abin10]|nr:hypothetical protein BMS3Abin10_02466 [bacterium BMS3Abin10]GBE39395.1 hypothetical protein BMS3Bbin08_02017 [bacterium BMS3Bbin08]
MAHKCLNCGATSDERVLFACVYQDEQLHVCVKCLPVLIHGAH